MTKCNRKPIRTMLCRYCWVWASSDFHNINCIIGTVIKHIVHPSNYTSLIPPQRVVSMRIHQSVQKMNYIANKCYSLLHTDVASYHTLVHIFALTNHTCEGVKYAGSNVASCGYDEFP